MQRYWLVPWITVTMKKCLQLSSTSRRKNIEGYAETIYTQGKLSFQEEGDAAHTHVAEGRGGFKLSMGTCYQSSCRRSSWLDLQCRSCLGQSTLASCSYPELNPVALVRSGYKARHTKKLPVPEAMKIVTPAVWNKYCDHIERVEEEYWEKDGLVELRCCGRNSDQWQ